MECQGCSKTRAHRQAGAVGDAGACWVRSLLRLVFDTAALRSAVNTYKGRRTAPHQDSKISSIGSLRSFEILNAKGRLGSYFSVSMALMVCLETPSLSARSDCDHSLACRNSRSLLFIGSGG